MFLLQEFYPLLQDQMLLQFHPNLSSHLIWKPSSPPSAQPHVPTSSSASMSFSKTSVTSPSCPSNDSKSPKRDQKGTIHRYEIPKHIQELIKNDIVPPVLKKPVSPSTYSDYFSTLLYAEDFYCEKWSDYLLEDVTVELLSKESYFRNHSGNKNNNQNSNKNKNKNKNKYSKIEKNNYFVTFEIDDVPERRPYLLSRDHVHLRPSGKGKNFEPFKGVIYRVPETKTVLTEFQDDFHRQHKESNKYDVSFSFNRVCLKRAHRAVSATTNPLLLQILFPNPKVSKPNTYINNLGQFSLINRILKHKGPIPYLVEGPLSDAINGNLTSMGNMIKETIFQIYKNINGSRVLICAPRNRTCDAFMRGIMEKVDKDELFRANAAFRDIDFVPDDIRQTSLYKDECFTCPLLPKLQSFRIITSTFISTYRLYEAGIRSGHFTHIFLVDASSWVEPEIIVSLTDFVSEDATLVVTGSQRDEPIWIRSDIGRKNGLRKSLFKRLLEREPYCSDDPTFVTRITENV
ncbi:hypothetical protein LUZ60_016658 [Juncus effusus]|nr:hypothetical protein LUZ60_016658 [Juncus effusus]